ncbi:hypothetical protein ARMGADRAFT_305882 [Armillaria gallica]|uniref:F-box domain-containing protein n=1 Tax=Armillaria gallica TaxID=47427 RepID=A0A2H3DFE1_ARMGA|nr:hypothetical protein ARMGADRAFT_305882 [Armillaria gallica]
MVLQIPLTLLEQMKMIRGKIPCLESFTMKMMHISFFGSLVDSELPDDVRNVFIDAPHLQKVILYDTPKPDDYRLPLHITHLATFWGNVSNLEAYQSLVECHFVIEEPDDSLHPIHLLNVRRLIISSSDLLSRLRLPSLDDLTISKGPGFGADMRVIVSMMNNFVYHSRCSLTRLAIYHSIASYDGFINDCPLLMDSLASLEIEIYWNMEDVFDALASIGFLPNSQHLLLRIRSIQPP